MGGPRRCCCNQREVDLGPTISIARMRRTAPLPPCATSTGQLQSRTHQPWSRSFGPGVAETSGKPGPTSKRSRKQILQQNGCFTLTEGASPSWPGLKASTACCPLKPPQGWPQKTGDSPGASLHHQNPCHRGSVHQTKVQDPKLNEHLEVFENKLNNYL